MPIVKHYSHLLGYLQEMGFYQSGGMGITPLTFTEIKSYLELMRLNLSAYEVSTIRKMSEAYTSMHHNNYLDTRSPFENEITLDELDMLISNADKASKKVI